MHSVQVSPLPKTFIFSYLSGCQNKSFQAKYVLYTEEWKGTPSRPFDEQKTQMSRRPLGSVCDLAGSKL